MNKKYFIAVAAGAALALGSCNSDDLDALNAGGDNGIELTDIGVGSRAATRYDGNTTWDTGDRLIVSGTARNSDATLTTTYTRQADDTWKQDTPDTGSGNTFLTIENTAAITRIESFGGETIDFSGSGTAPITKAQYLQSDHLLAVGSDITAGATIDKEHRTISATLVHQRADFVLTVSDGSGTLAYTADGSLANAALRISGTGTGSTPATYWAWNAGKTNDGKTTFRVILPAGFTIAEVTLYPKGDTNGSGSIDGSDTGKLVTLTGSDGSATGTGGSGITLDGGKRHTATLTYNEYSQLAATVTIGDWTEEAYNNGEEVGTGNPPVPTGYVITLAANRTDVTVDANTRDLVTINDARGMALFARDVKNSSDKTITDAAGTTATVIDGGDYFAADITLGGDVDLTVALGEDDKDTFDDGNVSSTKDFADTDTYANVVAHYGGNSLVGSHYFKGTFDGDSHTITGFTISGTYYCGLVGYLYNADSEVRDVTLVNASISGSSNYVGGIAGESYGTISGCTVSGGSITGNGGEGYVGGIVGKNEHGTVMGCTVENGITIKGTEEVGGIVGRNYNESTVGGSGAGEGNTVSGATIEGEDKVGGIVGENYCMNSKCTIIGNSIISSSIKSSDTGSDVGVIYGSDFSSGRGENTVDDNTVVGDGVTVNGTPVTPGTYSGNTPGA